MKKIGLVLSLCMVILPLPAQNYFTGNGGAGISLMVLAPQPKNLNSTEVDYPNLVQGIISSDFTNFSKIDTRDSLSLGNVLAETEQLVYAENNNIISAGNLTHTQYILSGMLTKTGAGYALQLRITDTKTGSNKAAYAGNCSKDGIEKMSDIKAASADLLAQMGVNLTAQGKTALLAVADNTAEAQTAMAKGVTARRGGAEVEALSYFIQAQNADPQLAEAASRVNIVSADITSGNVGADRRNDIAWRRAWIARLAECDAYVANYRKNTPLATALVYSTDLQYGKTDYSRETLPIKFDISLLIADKYWPDPARGVVDAVYTGLVGTGRASEWGLNWPHNSASGGAAPVGWSEIKRYDTAVELLNDREEVIGRQTVGLSAGWNIGFSGGKTTASYSDTRTTVTFPAVDANKVTDRLSIRVASLNGINANTAAQANRVSIMTWADWEAVQRRMIQGNRR